MHRNNGVRIEFPPLLGLNFRIEEVWVLATGLTMPLPYRKKTNFLYLVTGSVILGTISEFV